MVGQSKAGTQQEESHQPPAQAIAGAWEYKISSISLSYPEKLRPIGSQDQSIEFKSTADLNSYNVAVFLIGNWTSHLYLFLHRSYHLLTTAMA